MSSLVNKSIRVQCDECGRPLAVTLFPPYPQEPEPILDWGEHYREWIGILDKEPERDVWMVKISVGICELHWLRPFSEGEPPPDSGRWFLARWMD